MFPEWSAGIWWLVVVGGNIAAIVGLICLYAVMTYFFGEKVGEFSVQIVGIPLWLEVLALMVAACAALIALGVVLLGICAVGLTICGICWVLTWPWSHRYRRLFREYIGFNPKVKGLIWSSSKEQRKVDRKLKEYAVALQDALDRLEMEVRGDVRWELERQVNQARMNFAFARKAVHECGFWARSSHLDYLPKKRRERLARPLKAVA